MTRTEIAGKGLGEKGKAGGGAGGSRGWRGIAGSRGRGSNTDWKLGVRNIRVCWWKPVTDREKETFGKC